MGDKQRKGFSHFSINIVFVVLMLLGLSIVPKLSLQLNPSSRSNHLSVSFSWPGANPEMLEMEVTTKLEGAYARTKGLKEIYSTTYPNYGYISMEIDKSENIDAIKLYLSSITRSLAKEFPEGVTIGTVSGGGYDNAEEGEHLLLTYVITGPGTSQQVAQFAEKNIARPLSGIEGVEKINITGENPFRWVLYYDENVLREMNITSYTISRAINNYYSRMDGGKVLVNDFPEKSYTYLVFKGCEEERYSNIAAIPVTNIDGRVIKLGDIVTIDYIEREPSSYMRINGLNLININIFNSKGANIIDLSAKLQARINKLEKEFPAGYSVKMMLDNSVELNEELNTNLVRTALTVLILLIFVYIVSRSWKYLAIITISLCANILIALIFYKIFEIEIHLYTLAGIAVSFGIIIDNVIVMADHYRKYRDIKIVMAIIAATLTTAGAMLVMFNMNNTIMRNMWGFTTVIIINLLVSIVVALVFVPSLMEAMKLQEERRHKSTKARRRVVKFTRIYRRYIRFGRKYRWAYIIIVILAFGIPTFMLPASLSIYEYKHAEIYNKILSNETALTIKPWLDKILGGSLRLFIKGGGGEWRHTDANERSRTRLNVRMTMPTGATLAQMNEAMIRMENFVSGFPQVETFTTSIYSATSGNMTIYFHKEYDENSSIPERVKQELIRFANSIGNADSDISGVGRGFSNRTGDGYRSSSLAVTGYNYRRVYQYAEELRDELAKQRRVQRLYIGNAANPDKNKEFTLYADKKLLARNNSDVARVLSGLHNFSSTEDMAAEAYINGKLEPIILRAKDRERVSLWEMRNSPISGNNSSFRLDDIGEIVEEMAFEEISKRNQEYTINVQYDFRGDYMLAEKKREEVMKEMNSRLPVGFKVKQDERYHYSWGTINGIDERIWYIIMVIAIIWVICSILLESLRQSLKIVIIAPISFVGCFLGFYLFGLSFNEGGLAAFILMCGLSVNSMIYIFNDFNNKVRAGRKPNLNTYLSAYNAKITPIWLTTVSTILGFAPFLIGETTDFWVSLAVGTMSGLLFSLIVLIFVLPIFCLKYDQVFTK